jgi:hypothetical protein
MEHEKKGGAETRTEKHLKLEAGTYSYSENENGSRRTFSIQNRPGFITGGSKSLLPLVLARHGVSGTTYIFLGHDDEKLHTLEMHVGSVSADGFIAVKSKELKRNEETGKKEVEVVTFICRRSNGHLVEIKIDGVPLQIAIAERLQTDRPKARAEMVPVIAFFRGISKRDREMVEAAVDWDRIWIAFKESPDGKAKLGNKPPAEMEAAQGFFTQGILKEIMKSPLPPEAVILFTSVGSWEVAEGPSHTIVRLTQTLRDSDQSLASLKYAVDRDEAGEWKIVRLPGL